MIEYLTQSMINSFSTCPERFKRRYLQNEILPPGIAARIETGVHKGAEVNHRAKMQTGQDEPLDVIQDAARDGYLAAVEEGVYFSEDEKGTEQRQTDAGLETVVQLAALYAAEIAPWIAPVLVEETLTLVPDLGLYFDLTVPLRGTIDVYTADRWLPDLKTSSRRWSAQQAASAIQPTLYRELIAEATGGYPRKLSFEVLVKTKIPVSQSLEVTRDDEDFACLVKRIQVMLSMLEAGIFPPAGPDSWCCAPKWCGYFTTCPYMKHPTMVF